MLPGAGDVLYLCRQEKEAGRKTTENEQGDAVSKSWQVGANAWLFGLLTLVTNLFGVLCLWIYIKLHLLCPNCGKMQPRKANYCSVCGTAIYAICPDCGNRVSMKDEYCNGCGRKMRK